MVDGAHALEDALELRVAEHQRVAAADEHVADLGGALDVLDRVVDLGLGDDVLGAADQATARAVTAVHAAHLGDDEEHAVGVAVGDARRRRVEVLGDGVLDVLGVDDELGRRRDALHAHGVRRIVGVHERRVVGRDADPELAHAGVEVSALRVGEVEHALEVLGGGEAVAQLPAVVVPVGVADAAEARYVLAVSDHVSVSFSARPLTPAAPCFTATSDVHVAGTMMHRCIQMLQRARARVLYSPGPAMMRSITPRASAPSGTAVCSASSCSASAVAFS